MRTTSPTVLVAMALGLLGVLALLGIVALAALARPIPDVLAGTLLSVVPGLLGLLAPRPELLVQQRPSADDTRGRHEA